MLCLALATALLTSKAWAQGSCHQQADYANLTVTTRTGVFVGNLNDTYPNVRQFKYVPYAKV